MKRGLQIVTSTMVVVTPWVLAWYHASVRGGYDFGSRFHTAWLCVYSAMFLFGAFLVGLPHLIVRPRQAVMSSLLAAAAPLALSSTLFVIYDPRIPRFLVVATPGALFIVFLAASLFHVAIERRSTQTDRVLGILDADEVALLETDMAGTPERKFSLLGVCAPADIDLQSGPVLIDRATELGVNMIVLSAAAQGSERIVSQAASLHEQGMRVRSLTTFYEEWLGKLPLTELERTSLWFDIRDIEGVQYNRLKRIMDVLVALCAVPVLAVAIPLVWIGNLAGNRGPLFFGQPRVGYRGETFKMWKFRSMTAGPSESTEGTPWTAENDPRITRFGKILRRSHLDELPQVINVLAGDLSIVGPRPEQPHYVTELAAKIPFYQLRHAVRPGMTGWAQVKYPYGASEADAIEKLQYELYYLGHQSLSFDLRVCIRTIRSVIFGEGR